jgi:hypothetical protein
VYPGSWLNAMAKGTRYGNGDVIRVLYLGEELIFSKNSQVVYRKKIGTGQVSNISFTFTFFFFFSHTKQLKYLFIFFSQL